MGTLVDSKGEYFAKRANEVLDFTIDWADRLGTDIISNSTWSVPTGITKNSSTSNNTTATVWLSGGNAGTDYDCTNTVITAGALTLIQLLRIKVIPPAAVASTALISLGDFKVLTGLADTIPDSDPQNDLYRNLIEAASAEITGYCGRNFLAADYIEEVYAEGTNDGVILKEFPVAYVESIHDSTESAILLTNSAVNAQSARAWIAPNRKLYLQVVGGTSHGIVTIDLTLAANDTLGELVTAVNGTGSGWAAGLATGASSFDRSEYLLQSVGAPVPATGLYLQQLGAVMDGSFFFDTSTGIVRIFYRGIGGSQPTLWVRYRGGYDTIPADLQMLTARYALALQGELGRDPSLDSERIGDYSYTRAAGAGSVLLALEGQLRNWKSKAV